MDLSYKSEIKRQLVQVYTVNNMAGEWAIWGEVEFKVWYSYDLEIQKVKSTLLLLRELPYEPGKPWKWGRYWEMLKWGK